MERNKQVSGQFICDGGWAPRPVLKALKVCWRRERRVGEDTDVCVAGEGSTGRVIYAGRLVWLGVQRAVLFMEVYSVLP